MKTSSIQLKNLRQALSFSFTAFCLLTVASAAAGPKEIGAFVKGEWKPDARPEVSIVLFRWGASGVQTLTTAEDRMLGQVASRGQRSIEIVMRTPPRKPSPSSSPDSLLPAYEVRLRCGVQICGDGLVVPCGECPFSRKYNGDSLISRGAFTSNICCFDATFERVKRVDILHITDVIADGVSVPYIVKFNVKPTIMRSGTKVPIPAASRLHGASVSFRKLEEYSEGESAAQDSQAPTSSKHRFGDTPAKTSGGGAASAVSTSDQDVVCEESAEFSICKNDNFVASKFYFRMPRGGGRADLIVEGPGFRLRGASDLRTFAEGVKATYAVWQARLRSKKSSGLSSDSWDALSGVKFPRMEIPRTGYDVHLNRDDSFRLDDGWKEVSVRASIVTRYIPGRLGETVVQFETGEGQEIFSIRGGALPSLLQCLVPPPSIQNMLR